MKDRFSLWSIKAKNFYKKYQKELKSGVIFWVGIALVVIGGITFYNSQVKSEPTLTYASVERPAKQGMETIKYNFKKRKPFTLILHRPGCPACQKAESGIMNGYKKASSNAKTDYIILDITKMTSEEKQELISLLPQITIDGKIPSPLVANIKPYSDFQAKVVDMSNDDNPKNYNKVLEDSKNLGG